MEFRHREGEGPWQVGEDALSYERYIYQLDHRQEQPEDQAGEEIGLAEE